MQPFVAIGITAFGDFPQRAQRYRLMESIILIVTIILFPFIVVSLIATAIYHTVRKSWSSLMKDNDTSRMSREKQRLIFWCVLGLTMLFVIISSIWVFVIDH
jgi:cytosine/uracil/thiamine/allantoin permease